MTASIEAKPLIAALWRIKSSVAPSRTYDILQHVKVQAADGICSITAFDLSHEIVVSIPCEGDLSPCLVKLDLLVAWLAKCSDRGDVAVAVDDKVTTWKAGRASARLPLASLENWAGLTFEGTASYIVSGPALSEAIGSALLMVNEDAARPAFSGVRVEPGVIGKAGVPGRLAICGTNGVVLFARDIAATGAVVADGIILPIPTAKAVIGIVSGTKTATLSWNDRLVEISVPGVRFRSTLVGATYSDRWRLMIAPRDKHIAYEREAIRGALASVSALAPEKGEKRAKEVRLTFSDDATALEASEAYTALTVTDECPHYTLAKPPQAYVIVGGDQLLKLAEAMDAETVELSIGPNNGDPVIVTGAAQDDRAGCTVALRG